MLAMLVLGIVVIGQGAAPSSVSNDLQAKLIARRAAIVDVYRQFGGSQGVRILDESYNGKVYKVKATQNLHPVI